jgi:glycosyltransferase involved in cell wall biosynthesis
MKVLFFAGRMPDLCGAFLHDIDLATELQRRGHTIVFLTIRVPPAGVQGGIYRGFRYMHYTAGASFLETSDIIVCPHSPILPDVRKANARGYNRPILATCHFDGNYTAITGNLNNSWKEMLMFINRTMEPNYRKNIAPWPSSIVRTEVVRPIMHRDKIVIQEEFHGEYITLVNANRNKGIHVFFDIAKKMPERKFLGILPYYGELMVPPAPPNIDWLGFDDDIRNILKKTRILLVPSFYESFARIAVEAMINGIPVLYSKPAKKSPYPGGSTEGIQEWIGDAAIACEREVTQEWVDAIQSLDDEEAYSKMSEKSKEHIDSLNLFTEASRIASVVETFSRENPAPIRSSVPQQQVSVQQEAPRLREPVGPAGFGFSNGRLKIRR